MFDQGLQLSDWDAVLGALPPEVISVHDYILCSFPGYAEDYIQECLTILATGYGVEATMHKLTLLEQALGAEVELEQARTHLDSVTRRLTVSLRRKLAQEEAGQQVLL